MAWLHHATDVWLRRAPIAVDNTGGAPGSQYIEVKVPNDYAEFWDHVNQTDGRDVRVTDGTGRKLVLYQLVSFSASTRTLTIKIGAFTAPAAQMYQLWVYWDSGTATDGSSSVTTSSPKDGYIEVGQPTEMRTSVQPERPGDTRPRTLLTKASPDVNWLWWDLRLLLQLYLTPLANALRVEEVSYVSYTVTAAGSPQSGMIDVTQTRYIDGWVKTLVKAGSSGTDYTVNLTVTTSLGRTLTAHCWMKVLDVLET